MAENKKQHYVPQFYLKNFSHNRHIVYAYNLIHKREFRIAIKKICQEDYFYGSDLELEKSLSKIEYKQATIIEKLISNISVSSFELKDQFYLHLFILMLYSRTKISAKFTDEMINIFYDQTIKPALKEKGYSSQYIDSTSLKIENSQLIAMQTAMMGTELISDLFPIFLINKTDNIFVTSDNCICLYNYVKFKKHGTLGLQSPGLQIFCPLNKNIVLLLVDQKYYHIDLDENRGAEGIINIHKSSDIDAINKLQLFNCDKNVIYSDEKYQNRIIKMHSEVEPLLPDNFLDLTTFSKNLNIDGEFHEITRTSRKAIDWHLKLSFIRLNHKTNRELKRMVKRADKFGDPIVLCRDPHICEIVDKRFSEKK